MSDPIPVPTDSVVRLLPLEAFSADEDLQARDKIRQDCVRLYAQAMKVQMRDGGLRFPPVVAYSDGTHYWLGDGFHRILAARAAGLEEFLAEVRSGSRRDALLWSITSNADHGLPRTRADRRRAVLLLLTDAEWREWNNSEIGRRCQVSHTYVRILRKNLSCNSFKMRQRKVRRGDQVYEMGERTPSDRKPTTPDARPLTECPVPESCPTAEQPMSQTSAVASDPEARIVPATDNVGLPLPDSLREVFAGRTLFEDAQRLHGQLADVIGRLAQSPAGVVLRAHLVPRVVAGNRTYAAAELNFLGQKLAGMVPHCATCPRCRSKTPGQANAGCKLCGGRGWLSKAEFDSCPGYERQEVERLRAGPMLGRAG